MTNSEYEKLWNALRGPICGTKRDVLDLIDQGDSIADDILDGCANDDMDAIAPIVDEMIKQAEQRGKFNLLLEFAHEQQRKNETQIVH